MSKALMVSRFCCLVKTPSSALGIACPSSQKRGPEMRWITHRSTLDFQVSESMFYVHRIWRVTNVTVLKKYNHRQTSSTMCLQVNTVVVGRV